MLTILRPGQEPLEIHFILLDFEGTLASDRRVHPKAKDKINLLSKRTKIYILISWKEATDIVAGEIIRIKREYGPAGILVEPSSHHLFGNIGYRHSTLFRFMNLVGFTYADHNPDSWEGWFWGGMHTWGFNNRLGIPEQYDLLEDALKNTEMLVFWSSDPEATSGVYAAYESSIRRQWLKQLGVKMVVIDP